MGRDCLRKNVETFCSGAEERLKDLSREEQQQFLEGVVYALDGVTRYTSPRELTPFEREEFIGCSKANIYSRTYHLKLDPESHMRDLLESDGKFVSEAYAFAATIQEAMGVPLDIEQRLRLTNYVAIAQIGAMS